MTGLPSWASASLWFRTPGKKTVYGTVEDDWTTATTRQIDGCDWWHATTKELIERGRTADVEGRFVTMPLVDNMPDGTERVRFESNGPDFAIIGRIQSNKSASGMLDHADFYAERMTNRG